LLGNKLVSQKIAVEQEIEKKPRTKRKLFRWIKILLIVYCIIGILVYYLQDRVILHPVKLAKDYQYSFGFPHREINVPVDKNTNINIIQFPPQDATVRGVVLYFHGNKTNINRYRWFVPNFTQYGYEVWMIDYPGFGKSTGTFTEETAYEWALMMYKMARARFTPNEIVIYGKSLGSGIAAQLASVRDCKELILETPYYSIPSLAKHYLPIYPLDQMLHIKLPTYKYLTKVTAPIIIFHGTDDPLIPYSNAVRLKEVLKRGDEFVTIEGGNHRNLNQYPEMKNKLRRLLEK
jgi:alpha-beta hydrolase superfamily lysophospholipase